MRLYGQKDRERMQLDMAVETLSGTSEPDGASPGKAEDLALARACADGDPAAFEGLYREHGERMKSIAYNHLGNRADAEDAVQETFAKVHRAASTYNGSASFATWLHRILVNTCYDMLRKRQVRPQETDLDALLGANQEGTRTADEVVKMSLRSMLDRLVAARRSVFLLYEVEGMSHREIASVLGIQENYSKWLLFMAKQDLRKLWTSAH
jgi:RNA polymerase sigma-70 factor, ECF subfamily